MTNTTTTSTTETATMAVPLRMELVDPAEVLIETNVRDNPTPPRWLVASVKRHGVLIPVLAHPADDGRVIVRDGQLRILAAIEAERISVPAYIVDRNDNESLRIIEQLLANRSNALSESQTITAWKQLELDGLTPTAIAREVSEKPARIKTGLAVAGDDLAIKAIEHLPLNLIQALAFTEFKDDPAALTKLEREAKNNPRNFDHTAQSLRDARDRNRELQAVINEHTERGLTVLSEGPDRYDNKASTAYLDDLQSADGTPLNENNYQAKPGHAVVITNRWGHIDISHVVVNWKDHGLRRITRTGSVIGEWTDAEKAARKELIANNRAWESAERVRREWLSTLLSRKALPKNAHAFTATVLTEGAHTLSRALQDNNRLAHELLGLSYKFGQPNKLTALVSAAPTKAAHVSFAIVVAALEASTSKQSWRYPDDAAADYLRALESWGYPLSDVENLVLDITPTQDRDSEQTESDSAAHATPETGKPDDDTGGEDSAENEHLANADEPPQDDRASDDLDNVAITVQPESTQEPELESEAVPGLDPEQPGEEADQTQPHAA